MKHLRLGRNKKIAGVCSGFAEYFGCDPAMVRILMIVAVLCSCGYATLFYLLCMLFLDKPLPEEAYFSSKDKNRDYKWVDSKEYEKE